MAANDTPMRLWVGSDGRDYHPVFLTAERAYAHGWNDADGADAPEYIRADIVADMVKAGHLTFAHHIEVTGEDPKT